KHPKRECVVAGQRDLAPFSLPPAICRAVRHQRIEQPLQAQRPPHRAPKPADRPATPKPTVLPPRSTGCLRLSALRAPTATAVGGGRPRFRQEASARKHPLGADRG